MELRPEQLITAAAKRPVLQSIYLIAGSEPLRVIEASDAIRALAKQQGVHERIVLDAGSRDFSWGQLTQVLHAPSLLSPSQLIDLRLPSGKPGKEGSQVICNYCQQPPPNVVLLMTCSEWSKAHHGPWVDAIAHTGIIAIAWPIHPRDLPQWVSQRFQARQVRLSGPALHRFCERVAGNLLAAAQEIDKLALFAQGQILDEQQLDALVADQARYDVFRLIDAALSGQVLAVTRTLAGLRTEGVVVPALLPVMIREFIRLETLALIQHQHGRARLPAAMKQHGIWSTRQATLQRALQRHPNPLFWQQTLVTLGWIDQMSKGRRIGDVWLTLARLLLSVAHVNAPTVSAS